MNRQSLKFALAVALLLPAVSSFAQSTWKIQFGGHAQDALQVSANSVDSNGALTQPIQNSAVGVMNYSLQGASGSFAAFCIEPEQSNANAALGYRSYTVSSLPAGQTSLLQGLFSSSYGTLSNDASQQVAFQFAVWEIVREKNASLDIGSGTFSLSNAGLSPGAYSSIVQAGNSFLANALSYQGPALYNLTVLTNGTYQDLVVPTALPVPEASSLAMLLAGLGTIGFVAGRRRKV